MNGPTLLVLTIVCIANVGLSQPIESAKDKPPAPEKEEEESSTTGKPSEGDEAGEGGDKGESQFQTIQLQKMTSISLTTFLVCTIFVL